MQVVKREVEKATILAPKGKISIGVGDVILRDAINEAIDRGAKNLLLDFRGVSRMDSSGMGELLAAHSKMTRFGGRLKLVNMPSRLLHALGATQIVSVLDVFPDESEALASIE